MPFLKSFRSRLFAISMLLLLVFLSGVGIYVHQVLERWTESVIEEDLMIRAELVVDALQLAPEGIDPQEVVETFDGIKEQRLTIFGVNGEVVADTYRDARVVENRGEYWERPEVEAGLRGEAALTKRMSHTVGEEMLNAALPGPDGQSVVRLSVPLREVEEVLAGLRILLAISALFGLGGSILISGAASRLMTRILRNMLARARADEALETSPIDYDELEMAGNDGSLRRVTRALEQTLEELADQRNRFRAVLDGMNEGVVATEVDGRITMTNRAVRHLFGMPREPGEQELSKWVPQEIFGLLVESPDEIVEFETTSTTPRRIQAHATRRDDEQGYIFVFHDVTAIRQLERVKRDFVANVSHELRTPVTVIQANAETLLDGALDKEEPARRFTEGIHRNAERLGQLIADLLDLSRMREGEMELETRALDAAALVDEVVGEVQSYAQEGEATVSSELETGRTVMADEDSLRRVLTNLLENALKYGGQGVSVWVRGRYHEDRMILEVVDDGPGVSVEHQDRVFERFYRVEEGRSSRIGGTGLGLSIVKLLVSAMGGEVGCKSRDGGGSIFWFSLPLEERVG